MLFHNTLAILYVHHITCKLFQHAVQAAADSGLDGVMSVGITLFPKVSAGIWYARNKQTAANNQIRLNKLIALFRAPNNSK